jgi:ribonuclease HI
MGIGGRIHSMFERGSWNGFTNGWLNATLWRELDTAISRHRHLEFTWVKANSGILLSEGADQLGTRGVSDDSYSEKVYATPVPDDEPESQGEMEISE